MKIILYSITHDHCPVEIRERVSLSPHQQKSVLKQMHAEPGIIEAVILNTCNRIEFYICAKLNFDTAGYIESLYENLRPGSGQLWKQNCREKTETEAIKHLFRVSAGLDSQIVGENQILGQVKEAYHHSVDSCMSRFLFHRLFHMAFRVGKNVRTDTNINCGAVSISQAAVELAESVIDLKGAKAILVGAGKNSALAAKYLQRTGLKDLVIANRNQNRAQLLCEKMPIARPVTLDQISSEIIDAQLVISTTSSDDLLLTYDQLNDKIKDKVVMIDIAVPRDIDPKLEQLENVQLYNIDQLMQRINTNLDTRNAEIPKADQIVDMFTTRFCKWYDSLDIVPVISNLTRTYSQLARNEAKRYADAFNGDSDKLELFAESLVKKILHGPIRFLKNEDTDEPGTEQLQAIELVNKMFLKEQGEDK